jgi:hypothetical protein
MRGRFPTIAFVLMLSGCGGAGEGGVSGSVTFRGQPLEEGSIQFCTAGERSVPVAGARVVAGHYKVPSSHGLAPGTYVVRISSPEPIAAPPKDEKAASPFAMSAPQTRERIPAKYNARSTLTAEVRAGERARFDFDLKD